MRYLPIETCSCCVHKRKLMTKEVCIHPAMLDFYGVDKDEIGCYSKLPALPVTLIIPELCPLPKITCDLDKRSRIISRITDGMENSSLQAMMAALITEIFSMMGEVG